MKSWLIDRLIRLRASYWFVPALMAAGAILTAAAAVLVDQMNVERQFWQLPAWFSANQPAGARSLLATVAGSMITVAGVTFSMTLLAVSHASAQIGPRLLTGFMRDRANQITLGTFVATFLYCLLVLQTIRSGGQGDEAAFVPQLATLLGLVFALMSVAVLIHFMHHVPHSINVANVVARVGDELVAGIESAYPERLGSGADDAAASDRSPPGDGAISTDIRMTCESAYLRVLDAEALMNFAREHDVLVEMSRRPGDFVITGQTLARIFSAQPLDPGSREAFEALFSWGSERTPDQDVMYPAEQLLEILGKAMSPGVNGQHTALLCLNQVGRAIAALMRRDLPDAERFDEDDRLRVIVRPISYDDFVAQLMRPIRQFVRDDWIVTDHLLQVLRDLSALSETEAMRLLLDREIAGIREEVRTGRCSDAEKRALLA